MEKNIINLKIKLAFLLLRFFSKFLRLRLPPIPSVSALIEKNGIEKTKNSLIKKLDLKKIERLFEKYELDKVLNEIFAFIDLCNEYVQNKKPWETKDKKVLYELVDSIRKINSYLGIFIPKTAEKINKVFKTDKIKKSPILFEKVK